MNGQSKEERVLLQGANWKELRFFQKSEALYQMTFVFCERFLPKHGDRTVDQMVQAARSGKQNIIEGSEDGKTSTEMELKLLNVARSSIHELREDYKDYLLTRHLTLWDKQHPRYQEMEWRGNGQHWLHDVLPDRRVDERLSENPRRPFPQGGRHEGAHVQSAHWLQDSARSDDEGLSSNLL